MSLKELLGIYGEDITDLEIAIKIKEAQKKNLDSIEFNIKGDVIRVNFPHVGFDPDADLDSW